MNIRLACIALLLVLNGGARADLVPGGYKSVRSETLIEGMERYPDKKFVLAPVRYGDKSSSFEVKPGKDIRFYHLMSPNLYALKAGADLTDGTAFDDPAVPRSDVEITTIGPVRESETADFIRRVYRITGISGNHIALERQPDQRFDAGGKLTEESRGFNLSGAMLGGAAFLGVIVLWIRRVRAEGKSGAQA